MKLAEKPPPLRFMLKTYLFQPVTPTKYFYQSIPTRVPIKPLKQSDFRVQIKKFSLLSKHFRELFWQLYCWFWIKLLVASPSFDRCVRPTIRKFVYWRHTCNYSYNSNYRHRSKTSHVDFYDVILLSFWTAFYSYITRENDEKPSKEKIGWRKVDECGWLKDSCRKHCFLC